MVKKGNTILWAIGIIIFLIVAAKLPLIPEFAMVTKITCMDNTISYWDLNGNVLDARGVYNGINNGAIFIDGKLGQSVEFNTTTYIDLPIVTGLTTIMWVKDYVDVGSDWYFVVNSNGTNYVNGILDNTKQIVTIGPTFGLGFNGSIDEVAVFNTPLSASEISDLYIVPKSICYTTFLEENISCKDYATEQVTETGDGCLNYSGDFWPNCEFEWVSISQYQITENECERYFYCQENCTIEQNCYAIEQACIENLTYDCYVNNNEVCIQKTDYLSCVTGVSYNNLTECQGNLSITTTSTTGTISTGPTTTSPEEESFIDKLNQEVFEIAGFSFKLSYLIILLIIILGAIYFITSYKK